LYSHFVGRDKKEEGREKDRRKEYSYFDSNALFFDEFFFVFLEALLPTILEIGAGMSFREAVGSAIFLETKFAVSDARGRLFRAILKVASVPGFGFLNGKQTIFLYS